MTEPKNRPRPPSEKEKLELNALQGKLNDAVYKSLDVWRTGFAAIMVVASGGLTISALERMSKTGDVWRWALASLVVAGTILGIITLTVALRNQVGTSRNVVQRQTILETGGVLAFETNMADAAARRMHRSQRWGIASLAVLVIALAVLWLAPPTDKDPKLQVVHGTQMTCGTLDSADGQIVYLEVKGMHDPVAIPFQDIKNMQVVLACPAS